jgi:hypothetical protein
MKSAPKTQQLPDPSPTDFLRTCAFTPRPSRVHPKAVIPPKPSFCTTCRISVVVFPRASHSPSRNSCGSQVPQTSRGLSLDSGRPLGLCSCHPRIAVRT